MQLQPVYRVLRACDWLVVGPFASGSEDRGHAGPGMEVAYGPEARRDLQQSYEGDRGQALRWTRPDSEAGYVNLHALTGAYNYRVSYAVTDLDSPDDRRAELRFGVDYWARIWLNGQVVFEQTGPHGPPVEGQYTVSLTLRRGHNELLIKTHAGSAGNGFWCAISDPGDLRVSPGPKTGDS
jgi:beta-galactosidase